MGIAIIDNLLFQLLQLFNITLFSRCVNSSIRNGSDQRLGLLDAARYPGQGIICDVKRGCGVGYVGLILGNRVKGIIDIQQGVRRCGIIARLVDILLRRGR